VLVLLGVVAGLLLLPALLLQLPLVCCACCAPDAAARWRDTHPRLARLAQAYGSAERGFLNSCCCCLPGTGGYSRHPVMKEMVPPPPPPPGPPPGCQVAPAMPTGPFDRWSPTQLAGALRQAGMGEKLASRVERQSVDGCMLRYIVAHDGLRELGVTSVVEQARLARWLPSGGGAGGGVASVPAPGAEAWRASRTSMSQHTISEHDGQRRPSEVGSKVGGGDVVGRSRQPEQPRGRRDLICCRADGADRLLYILSSC